MLSKLLYYFDLVLVLTLKEIKVRYKNSLLGYLWSVMNPIIFSLVFYFAFKKVLKTPLENFHLYLIVGLFPWQWFSDSTITANHSLLHNAQIIKKVYFSRFLLPVVNLLNTSFHFIFSLPVVLVFCVIYKANLYPNKIYLIPLVFLSQFFITLGISLIISSLNLFFRDTERFSQIGLQLMFYLTPILYEAESIPNTYKFIEFLNPLFSCIESWHSIFLGDNFKWDSFFVSLVWGFALMTLGSFVFKKFSWRFAEVI